MRICTVRLTVVKPLSSAVMAVGADAHRQPKLAALVGDGREDVAARLVDGGDGDARQHAAGGIGDRARERGFLSVRRCCQDRQSRPQSGALESTPLSSATSFRDFPGPFVVPKRRDTKRPPYYTRPLYIAILYEQDPGVWGFSGSPGVRRVRDLGKSFGFLPRCSFRAAPKGVHRYRHPVVWRDV